MFGIIVAVLTSNYVASLVLHYGVYESEVERDGKNVYYLHPVGNRGQAFLRFDQEQ